MLRFLSVILLTVWLGTLATQARALDHGSQRPPDARPLDVWAFRSVLDKQPRMLTLALDQDLYLAYDLARCAVYKAWKGGVLMDGAAYTDRKNVQPTSWGTAYFTDTDREHRWIVRRGKKELPTTIISQGYRFKEGQIYLGYYLILTSGDTIRIEERPEFISDKGKPGLERVIRTSGIPIELTVTLTTAGETITIKPNGTTRLLRYFEALPKQAPPRMQDQYDHLGRYWMEKSDCFTCHELEKPMVGPALQQIASRYPKDKETRQQLISKVKQGGSGTWGSAAMNAHPALSDEEVKSMLDYIFTLKPKEETQTSNTTAQAPPKPKEAPEAPKPVTKPGFGEALEGLHPSYKVSTIRPEGFKPRVGAMAFLPDGRLLVSTWDTVGGLYLLDGVQSGDGNRVKVKRIASGLAEPLGMEVVDGEIYVLQKHELTRLIDHDGDEVIDEYRPVCNSWGVTDDFHEFAFGLVHKDGYFYVTLSMAMRLMAGQKQHPDRGRTLKISKNGTYEWLNYGLRTPNGIGLGPDDELFVTDNQGQWLPANKLIHVKRGEYHGMAWGLDDPTNPPPMAMPAIWLPEDEIGNSPSEVLLMRDGPYKGQLLHGEVTHGGIKRDFLEKVDGQYQGAVFRFTQGLEAGINRMRWGPDGALYVGGVGMVGGWSWKEKQYGLQRMKYTGKPTFEMLAVRARPKGFEIELTEPLSRRQELKLSDILVQQWWYLPTASYGGPKKDLETLSVSRMELSKDRTKLYLEIPGLKEEHVVYFRLPDWMKSTKRRALWSGEAWYTLNRIPK
ncbi:c-type cytochrome [Telluribacter sp. SYSU D00476]|uniref:c-type cytochrome n=1 Tax=Telluribacter sp. SYSU D00476 TaxID=2811430 RepID=UPI001FF41F6F|nr:c-type cytochrome [Telluribacter sp. SYSU D00476]